MKDLKTKDLREFIKYVFLNVLGMLGLSCYILADTFFVSKGLGANGLTALNLAIPVYSFIHGSGLMIGMGAGTKYSIYQSQEKKKEANVIFTNAVYLAGAFAVIFFILGCFFSKRMAQMLGADENVLEMTKTYLQVILLFAPAFLMNNVLICFVRNDGAPNISMAAMVTGSLSNVVLDYIFIFPLNMGIFGAVLATGFAPLISIGVLSSHFWKKRNQFHFVRCSVWLAEIKGICLSGIPSLITEVASGVVMIIFNMIILKLQGNIGVAAYGVIANLSLVIISVYTGIAQGMQPIMSSGFGSGNLKKVQRILKYGLVLMGMFSLGIYLVIFICAAPLTAIFNSEGNVMLQKIAEQGMKIYFLACPFAGFNIILSVYFTSVDCPLPANVISILRGIIVIIPLTFLMAAIAKMTGVWLSFPLTEGCVAAIGAGFWMVTKKKMLFK